MQFLVKAMPSGGKDLVYEAPDIPLNQVDEAGLVVDNGRLTMPINGHRFSANFVARDPGWQALRYDFKAGNHPRDAERGDGRNLSIVRIHAPDLTDD